MLTCFGKIWNCDNFSRWNTKFGKIYTLKKISIYSKLIVRKKWHIGGTINTTNNFFQIFHLKIPFDVFIWQKDPKKDNSPKSKVNTLAC
jgi:hypothetical protein